jgi:uncharacterized protein
VLLGVDGAGIDAVGADGQTPLQAAAWDDLIDVARSLIDGGADVNARDEDGDTALHMAAWKNSVRVARLLIERGADIEAAGEGGFTPLQRAAMENYPYALAKDVAQLLIDSGAKR